MLNENLENQDILQKQYNHNCEKIENKNQIDNNRIKEYFEQNNLSNKDNKNKEQTKNYNNEANIKEKNLENNKHIKQNKIKNEKKSIIL